MLFSLEPLMAWQVSLEQRWPWVQHVVVALCEATPGISIWEAGVVAVVPAQAGMKRCPVLAACRLGAPKLYRVGFWTSAGMLCQYLATGRFAARMP